MAKIPFALRANDRPQKIALEGDNMRTNIATTRPKRPSGAYSVKINKN
jgi:hypothetical protein